MEQTTSHQYDTGSVRCSENMHFTQIQTLFIMVLYNEHLMTLDWQRHRNKLNRLLTNFFFTLLLSSLSYFRGLEVLVFIKIKKLELDWIKLRVCTH